MEPKGSWTQGFKEGKAISVYDLRNAKQEIESLRAKLAQAESENERLKNKTAHKALAFLESEQRERAEKAEAQLARCVEVLTRSNEALERNRIIFTDWSGPKPKQYIPDFLASLPASAKANAEVLMAAREHYELMEEVAVPKRSRCDCSICQAVRKAEGERK